MRYSVRKEGKRRDGREEEACEEKGVKAGCEERKERRKKQHGKLKHVRGDLKNAVTKNEKYNEIMNRRNIPVLSSTHQKHSSSTHKPARNRFTQRKDK